MAARIGIAAVTTLIVVSTLAGCGSGSGGHSSVVGVLWQWNGLQETHPASLSAVPNPQNYLLVLNKDGSFEAKADCNQLSGTYSLSGSNLTLKHGPMTRAQCGPDSLSDKYVSLLAEVASQTVSNDQLTLGLKNGAGSMFFHTD
jgi:heat shock protein HslJ